VLVVVVSVVVLNALIALLGDSYSRVQEKSTANKNMERAKLIVEYLCLLPRSTRQSIEDKTRYIHVLIPKQHLLADGHVYDGDESEWEGSFFILMAIILGGFTVIFKVLLREVEGACKLQLSSGDDGSAGVVEDCDAHPFTLYGLAAFNVFNMGIMVRET
jgi:hypothetical protein